MNENMLAFFDGLDNEQHQAAIEMDEPGALVLAGPGSGKTRTLVAKALMEVVEDKSPVYVVTFTTSAAAEISERLDKLTNGMPKERQRLQHVGTLHSWALDFLRWCGDTREVVDDIALSEIMAETANRLRLKKSIPVKRLVELVSGAEGMKTGKEQAFVEAFANDMKEHGLISYDGILHDAAEKLLTEGGNWGPNPIFLIDEAQDSSVDDLQIYDRLSECGAKLWMVGDMQQAIYSFRHPVKVDVWNWCVDRGMPAIELRTNYRSSTAVINALNVINKEFVPRVQAVPPESGAVPGEVTLVQADVEGIVSSQIRKRIIDLQGQYTSKPEEFAVLCRTNREVELLAMMLGAEFNVRTKKAKGELVPERLWAALGFYRQPGSDWAARRYLRSTGADEKSASKDARRGMQALGYRIFPALFAMERTTMEWPQWMDVLQVPKKEQGWFTERLGEGWTDLSWDEIMIRLIERPEEQEEGSGITVKTIHSAKGREWRHVLMPFCDNKSFRPKNGPEEERVFYVGASRAIETLTFFYAASRVDEFKGGSIDVAMCSALERIVEAGRK